MVLEVERQRSSVCLVTPGRWVEAASGARLFLLIGVVS